MLPDLFDSRMGSGNLFEDVREGDEIANNQTINTLNKNYFIMYHSKHYYTDPDWDDDSEFEEAERAKKPRRKRRSHKTKSLPLWQD